MTSIAIAAIRFYQRNMRHLHNRRCIYTPSCSNYGILALEKYGLLRGLLYTCRRIRRCNGALYRGGEDYP